MYNQSKMFITADMKTSEIILSNPYLVLMLEHFGINLGVGDKMVAQICCENEIGEELFLTVANLFNGYQPSPICHYQPNDIQTIIGYLKSCHQYYQLEKYPQILNYIQQIDKSCNPSEIVMIERFFSNYFNEVTEHLDYENRIVFPYVLNLNNILSQKMVERIRIDYSVTDYKEHHNDIEEKLADLKSLLIKYLPQNNDQQLRRQLLFSLFELEHDLKIHSKIEDSILIPLVERMEQLENQLK